MTNTMVDQTTIRWVESTLSSRIARLKLNGFSSEVLTTRGCPQGGILSLLLWTLVVDLYNMAELCIDTFGYDDDLVIIVRGSSQSTTLHKEPSISLPNSA